MHATRSQRNYQQQQMAETERDIHDLELKLTEKEKGHKQEN